MEKRQAPITASPAEIASMRRELRLKYNVPDDQLDEIIAIALELKAKEEADARASAPASEDAQNLVSTANLQDNRPTITAIELERAAYIQDERLAVHFQSESERAERKATARSLGRLFLWSVFAALCVSIIGVVAATSLAVQPIAEAMEKASRVETRLNAVIISQANLASALVDLGGPESLNDLAEAVQDARPGPERLVASDALWVAMSTSLGELPVPRSYAEIEGQRWLELELADSHRAFQPDRERYDELIAEWAAAADNDLARWAIELGLTQAPPLY